jgi:hypothetical protein
VAGEEIRAEWIGGFAYRQFEDALALVAGTYDEAFRSAITGGCSARGDDVSWKRLVGGIEQA